MFGRRPKVPAAVAAGTDGYHRYRLQQQLVPMVRTDGPFSSSVNLKVQLRVRSDPFPPFLGLLALVLKRTYMHVIHQFRASIVRYSQPAK